MLMIEDDNNNNINYNNSKMERLIQKPNNNNTNNNNIQLPGTTRGNNNRFRRYDDNNNYGETTNNSIAGYSTATNIGCSSGTRFAPMEIEEAFQPLRIAIQHPEHNNNNYNNNNNKNNNRSSSRNSKNRNRSYYFSYTVSNNNNNNNNNHNDLNHQHSNYYYEHARIHPIDRLLIIIRLHFEYYPRITSIFLLLILGIIFYFIIDPYRKNITRNRLSQDYTTIDLHYNWKATQIHHWCLWGGDEDCSCDDFTDPIPRDEIPGWMETHRNNIQRITNNTVAKTTMYDVIFYGDEMVQSWTGYWLNNISFSESDKVAALWNKTFTTDGGGDLNGIPLGIMGDEAPHLLWRLQNGEMPEAVSAKVFWIHIGTNDLAIGGCSEEVVLLSILRIADEIHFHHPQSVIVIQGILPRTTAKDGTLDITSNHRYDKDDRALSTLLHHYRTHGDPERAHSADEARKLFHLWPSIVHINSELEKFCQLHDHLIYFDANNLFLGSVGNDHYRTKKKQIISDLMPDMIHPSYSGYKIMAKAISNELKKIIIDHDERNDIEQQNNEWNWGV